MQERNMQVTRMSPEHIRWFKRFAENEGCVIRGQISLRQFFTDIANGEYTIVKTSSLEKLKKHS